MMRMLAIAALLVTSVQTVKAQVADFDSIKLYTLKNAKGMTVKVTN